jgi:16S rRNA (adenine1518-N6/adenine1519-N6)-dimethyltransferase
MVSARSARQRELGQNFLIDPNILDVIERLAELDPDDVVLEVGGGPGVLSVRLAPRVRHLHVVEVDERLREGLARELAPFENVSLHLADAVEMDLSGLDPPPGKMVANLPYGVAATVILRTVADLPGLGRWVVMVQREVGERFAAAPGTAAYGVPSVLAQLACEVKVLRSVSRRVFRPVPNVDSVLLGLHRHGPGADPALTRLVHAAFAHRRKALAGSLALARAGDAAGFGSDVRERARAALRELGHPADERAERLAPGEFRELATRLGASA